MADSFGAETLQEPESHPHVAARRKAVTLRFARMAASALHAIVDPEGVCVIS
jgi:hypothetical protein